MIGAIVRAPFIGIGSCFGIGYLQVWHRHWSAFVATVIAIIAAIFNHDFMRHRLTDILVGSAGPMYAFGYSATIACLYCLLLTLVFGWFFIHVYEESSEHFVLDAMTAQFAVLALSGPGVLAISAGVRSFIEGICDSFLVCPEFLYNIVVLMLYFSVPFFVLRFFDVMEFWPASSLRVHHGHNVIYVIISSLSGTIYSLILIYLVAFILYGLSVDTTVVFFQAMTSYATDHCISVLAQTEAFFSEGGTLFTFLKKIGFIDFFSSLAEKKDS